MPVFVKNPAKVVPAAVPYSQPVSLEMFPPIKPAAAKAWEVLAAQVVKTPCKPAPNNQIGQESAGRGG